MKKALVTGACGFVGSHLVEFLVRNGWEVRATDLARAREGSTKEESISFDFLDIEFIPSDLTDKKSLKRVLKGIDDVFHLAAVFDFLAPWEIIEKVNVHGFKNICEASLEEGIDSFVHLSTVGVYGPPQPEYIPICEDSPKNPENFYEKSKWMQELIALKFYEKYRLPLRILRPVPIYGPRAKYGTFIGIYMMARGQTPFRPAQTKRVFTANVHIKDVLRAAVFLRDSTKTLGEAYNIVDDSLYTVYDYAQMMANLLGDVRLYNVYGINLKAINFCAPWAAKWSAWEAKYITHKRQKMEADTAQYIAYSYCYSNKKIKDLGFEFEYPDALVGLRETIEWYKRHNWI